jgi:hypothetical protein
MKKRNLKRRTRAEQTKEENLEKKEKKSCHE